MKVSQKGELQVWDRHVFFFFLPLNLYEWILFLFTPAGVSIPFYNCGCRWYTRRLWPEKGLGGENQNTRTYLQVTVARDKGQSRLIIFSFFLGNPDDLVPLDRESPDVLSDWRDVNSLHLLNLVYDVTPPHFVSMVITEVGKIPCTSVPVVLRVQNPEQ